jgi:hypothetical protein
MKGDQLDPHSVDLVAIHVVNVIVKGWSILTKISLKISDEWLSSKLDKLVSPAHWSDCTQVGCQRKSISSWGVSHVLMISEHRP